MVALTLPNAVVHGLRKFHPDLAWAIVTLFEKRPPASTDVPHPDAELVGIDDRRSLIVVNAAVLKQLPGVEIIPLGGTRAFLALESGRGMSDLELVVRDRLEDASISASERRALVELQALLRKGRQDRRLRVHSRAIVVVERVARGARAGNGRRGLDKRV